MNNQSKQIVINKIFENQTEAAFELVCQAFSSGSEIHKALKITPTEYREFLRPSFSSMLAEKLSLIAFDQSNKQILGCLIACDFSGHNSQIDQVPDRFKPISALLNQLESKYQQIRQFKKGQCMLVDLVVVDPVARGLGIYYKLREAAHDMAKSNGFDTVIGELSSAATQHVCVNKLGHKVMAEIKFSRFQFDETLPFSRIENPSGIQLVEFQLN